jgi:HEAT repeat protein
MVRAFAVCVYGGIAQLPSDEKVIREIVSALLDALNGDSNAVALAAACALGWLANVQNPPSRKTAKLRNWRPRETDLEPIIRYVTNHSGNLETKRWCVTILGGLREDWDNDVDKLQDSLTPPFVVELLRSLLDFTEKSGLEQVAARTLCRLGWSDPHCVPHLITYLMDTTTDHNLRCEAAEFLGCIGGSAAVSALMATALGNGNPESVRESSFLAFVRLADASALSQFIERSVEDDKWHKRASQILEDLPG